jgi:thiamine-monophosphate kinase
MPPSGEDDLIARYFRPLAQAPGSLGLLDDAAVLDGSADDLVITTDAIVEGVHYLVGDPPETIARKALRVNLSDLAAKGSTPVGFLLTLALRKANESWLAAFAGALGEDATTFACPLLGGDTVSTSGPVMISITAFGRVPKGEMVRRHGARPGDLIAVTGTIGDAALGLDILRGGRAAGALPAHRREAEFLVDRYRIPQPRLAIAAALRASAGAAMDVSDGLAGDLAKLCAVSGVSANVELAKVPLSIAARAVIAKGATTVEALIAGGDDYEVLCAVSPARWSSLAEAAAAAGVAITEIGTITRGQGAPVFLDESGHAVSLARTSYSHF